jgi:hypothetical protein
MPSQSPTLPSSTNASSFAARTALFSTRGSISAAAGRRAAAPASGRECYSFD